MDVPINIKALLDKYLPLTEKFAVKTFDWLPGYIVKHDVDHTRIINATLLQDKMHRLGLTKIKIPRKYTYKDFVMSELIGVKSWFESQRLMTVPMLQELHQLIAEGQIKYYEIITRNWVPDP